ncbi:MAG: aldolase/citrate lyase family protein [Cyclobacteriaceae bacterium]
MKTYFFIPANNPRFLNKAAEIKADEIILDLEDAIYNSNIYDAVENIIKSNLPSHYLVRLNFDPAIGTNQFSYLFPLFKNQFYRFIVPKIQSSDQLEMISDFLNQNLTSNKKLELYLLIENPKSLIDLNSILKRDFICGLGLGSHDYCESIGMNHTFENISWARMSILNYAKAYAIEAIDIASMNISDENEFLLECHDGFEKGFNAKFIIHPWQLRLIKSVTFFGENEISLALKVKQYIVEIGGVDNFTIAKIDGQIIERPHLLRFKKILKETGNEGF